MRLLNTFLLLLVASINQGTTSFNVWRRYAYVPGVTNCRIDGGYYDLASSSPDELHCVAKLSNSSGVWGGRIHDNDGLFAYYASPVDQFTAWSPNQQLEVLDINSSLTSWVPFSLNPPENMLIDFDYPHSSNKFVCRTYTMRVGGYITTVPGFLENGECHTWSGADGIRSSFEVLILNQRSRLFFQYNFQQLVQVNPTKAAVGTWAKK